jgi:YVTN family beta-propeller protein
MFDSNDEVRRTIDINQDGFHDSFTGDLAFDFQHNILYAADQANQRVAVIDARTRQVVASVAVGRLPFAMALSPDRRKLYVTNAGMFTYQLLRGADADRTRSTGLPFPAFGFPSPAAARGSGTAPGLGDANAPESNSVAVLDVSQPAAARVVAWVRTGLPVGAAGGGSGPSGVCATADRVFVSNANQDSIAVLNAHTNELEAEIPIRIPGLEGLRGVLPIGMAYHEKSGWLLGRGGHQRHRGDRRGTAPRSGTPAGGVVSHARRRGRGHGVRGQRTRTRNRRRRGCQGKPARTAPLQPVIPGVAVHISHSAGAGFAGAHGFRDGGGWAPAPPAQRRRGQAA